MNVVVSQSINHVSILNNNKMNSYKDIYEQHVTDVSFLWILRSIAVDQPHYNRQDIYELEQRIDAHLNGLMVAVEDSWEICLEALELEGPGEVFTSAVIAFKSHDTAKIQKVIEEGLKTQDTFRGLVSALGWLPEALAFPWIEKFLTSKDLNHKYLAIGACSVRRMNPGEHLNRILTREDCKEHKKLYARAIRLVGELKRQDLNSFLEEAANADNEEIKFWANWSSILLGIRVAVTNLEPYVFQSGPYQLEAINIVFRVLTVEQARNLISKLSEDKKQIRLVIQAVAVLGDPHAVNWLISTMNDPALARVCAQALCYITGIDLEQYQLVSEPSLKVASHPSEETDDDDVSLDEDENLQWPDVNKISQVWNNLGTKFTIGHRYFMGQEITQNFLKDKILNANQRQRHAAAMELAILDPAMPLENTHSRVQVYS